MRKDVRKIPNKLISISDANFDVSDTIFRPVKNLFYFIFKCIFFTKVVRMAIYNEKSLKYLNRLLFNLSSAIREFKQHTLYIYSQVYNTCMKTHIIYTKSYNLRIRTKVLYYLQYLYFISAGLHCIYI